MKKVAVIGIGIMGNGIALNFLKKGYTVFVWNRNKNKLKDLISDGAISTVSPKEAAEKADIIFEVTANDESSKKIWTSKNGILIGANSRKILIICATLSIDWTNTLIKLCKDRKFTFFDMPMTGGRIGAETGKLILLVGGNEKMLEKIKKDLSAIAEKIVYFGKEGSGMRFKLILNTVQAIHLAAFGEAIHLAKMNGLDIKKVGGFLSERPGGISTNIAWRDYQKNPKEVSFSIKWITKDLIYAKKGAKGLKTQILDGVLNKFQNAMKKNLGEKDWTTINKIA